MKKYYIVYVIIKLGDKNMNLLEQILNATSDEEADKIITERIKTLNESATKEEILGFTNNNKSVSSHNGFIPFNTRIRYENLAIETYSMDTTDFFYEFAHMLRKYKIDKKGMLIYQMESFINNYFGYPGKISRETVFNDYAWNTTTTDEEYFEALKNNKIGNLKGTGAAECTERGAIAQQLLSLFGTDSYYCIGCTSYKGKEEAHCFNVIKKNDYAVLDYSIPVESYKSDGTFKEYYPFVGLLSNEEFIDFIETGKIKTFNDYRYVDGKKENLDTKRQYVVGKYSLTKETDTEKTTSTNK